ncbi:18179_t:CDS:2, partial [Racocetra fulgida]
MQQIQQQILTEEQTKTIMNLKDQLQKKIKKEEEEVSNEITDVVYIVTKN